MTNDIRFTFSIGNTTKGGLQLISSKMNWIGDTTYNIFSVDLVSFSLHKIEICKYCPKTTLGSSFKEFHVNQFSSNMKFHPFIQLFIYRRSKMAEMHVFVILSKTINTIECFRELSRAPGTHPPVLVAVECHSHIASLKCQKLVLIFLRHVRGI